MTVFEKMRKLIKSILLFCVTAVLAFLFISVPLILAVSSDIVVIMSLFLPIVAGTITARFANKINADKTEISGKSIRPVCSTETSKSEESISDSNLAKFSPLMQDYELQTDLSQTKVSALLDSSNFPHSKKTDAAESTEMQNPAPSDDSNLSVLEKENEIVIDVDDSTFAIIKEEIACWNWQLIVGGLIFCMGLFNLLSSFFFAIVLLVLGLGILSIGITKYKEKQELQERELKRKIMAAAAKESPSEEKTDPEPNPEPADKKQTNRANTKCQTYKVAGVTHYIENIKNLGIENEDYFKSQRELIAEDMIDERIWKYEFYTRRALLQPQPDNPADPNAIKVIVDCEHVGYIKSGSCSHVHKLIKNHAIADVICTIGGGPYKCVSEEYDDEKDEDVYILEKGETNFFVHLEIYEKVDVSNSDTK